MLTEQNYKEHLRRSYPIALEMCNTSRWVDSNGKSWGHIVLCETLQGMMCLVHYAAELQGFELVPDSEKWKA